MYIYIYKCIYIFFFSITVYEKLCTTENRQYVVDSAKNITSPSQLIWGAEDMVREHLVS